MIPPFMTMGIIPPMLPFDGFIKSSIEWADKVYKDMCKSKEPAVAYIKVEGVSIIRELVVISNINGEEIHYKDKAIIENLHSCTILPSEQFEELKRNGFIIIKKY